MIKLPQLKLVQIFVEHLVSIYGDLKQAQSDESDEGSKVSRKETELSGSQQGDDRSQFID